MFNNFFNQDSTFKEGEFSVEKSIFRDSGYECNIYDIPSVVIPINTWSFDLYLSVELYEPKTYIWSNKVDYIKYHIEGVKVNMGWDLYTKITPSNNNFLKFYIEKNGMLRYSSEKKCNIKYKLLLN